MTHHTQTASTQPATSDVHSEPVASDVPLLSPKERAQGALLELAGQKTKQVRELIGTLGEDWVIGYFEELGWILIARNVAYPCGEIDLIFVDNRGVCRFIEVKTRNSSRFGAAEAVTRSKMRKFRRAVGHFLAEHPTNRQIQLDVVALTVERDAETGVPHFFFDHYEGVDNGAS